MPQVSYVVDYADGAWGVSLNDKRFGPYSTLETAVAAASKAAHKAEAQGYEATVTVETDGAPAQAEAERNAA